MYVCGKKVLIGRNSTTYPTVCHRSFSDNCDGSIYGEKWLEWTHKGYFCMHSLCNVTLDQKAVDIFVLSRNMDSIVLHIKPKLFCAILHRVLDARNEECWLTASSSGKHRGSRPSGSDWSRGELCCIMLISSYWLYVPTLCRRPSLKDLRRMWRSSLLTRIHSGITCWTSLNCSISWSMLNVSLPT